MNSIMVNIVLQLSIDMFQNKKWHYLIATVQCMAPSDCSKAIRFLLGAPPVWPCRHLTCTALLILVLSFGFLVFEQRECCKIYLELICQLFGKFCVGFGAFVEFTLSGVHCIDDFLKVRMVIMPWWRTHWKYGLMCVCPLHSKFCPK